MTHTTAACSSSVIAVDRKLSLICHGENSADIRHTAEWQLKYVERIMANLASSCTRGVIRDESST